MKSARPILSALRGRGLSAQAAARPSAGAQGPQVSRLPNGVVVASVDNGGPVSRVGIFYNAGSRYESGEHAGVTHGLRCAADISSKKNSIFGMTRSLQQLGASMSCTSSRECMAYSLECSREYAAEAFPFFGSAATEPDFRRWEVDACLEKVHIELAALENMPDARVMEALHAAAFRTGLGRSLYMNPKLFGRISAETMREFAQKHYVSNNMAVVGVGIDHSSLVSMTKKLDVGLGGKVAPKPTQFGGGEIRIETGSPLVHAAVVTEGASMSSGDLAALCVLHQVMGAGSVVKYGSNAASSRVGKAAASAASGPVAASTINATYTDGGLFGFQVVTTADDADKVLRSVAGAFAEVTKGGISDADVSRGKNQLKASVGFEYESAGTMLEDMGFQAAANGEVISPTQFESVVDKVTTADVQAVAKKVINGKAAMAAIGNLENTPYMDQLR